jgi:hypothetical protein
MLKNLMCVDDIESVGASRHLEDVSDLEADVGRSGLEPSLLCPGDDSRFRVDPCHQSRSDDLRQVEGDGAWSTADIEKIETRPQPWQQIGR